jgi:subtilisin-like proprotein convertase family protein
MRQIIRFSIAALCASALSPGYAAVVYDESASGDLSNSGLNPTPVVLAPGSNHVLGTTGGDRDYFTVTVPAGAQLTFLTPLPGTQVGDQLSFIGIQEGNQVTVSPNTITAAGLLGWGLYSPAEIGKNLLQGLGVPSNGSKGFTPPLGPGTYSFWIQEVTEGAFPYGFDLQMTQVTPPAQAATKTFSNGNTIKINDLCADPEAASCVKLLDFYNIRETNVTVPVVKANTYGSGIKVPANAFPKGARIKDVNVTLKGLSHQLLDDVDVLLVAPDGKYVMLMSNVNGSTAATGTTTAVENLTFIFDDSAALPLPNSTRNDGLLTTSTTSELAGLVYDEWVGVWTDTAPHRVKPTDYDPANPLSVDDLDQFPAPAPAGLITPGTVVDTSSAVQAQKKLTTSGPLLSTFNGSAPAGTWKLYVVDDFFWYKGEIKGGWSLEITAEN